MRATEFAGAPLVAGSVVGVRAFDIDSLGRLHGVTHRQVWTPGENVAECKVPTVSAEAMARYRAEESTYRSMGAPPPRRSMSYRVRDAPHDIGSCTCGFYAYYSGANDYANGDRVQAVIEGCGETTIGTRGFRTSKARIVALCIQAEPSLIRGGWKNKTVASVADKYGGIAAATLCVPGFALNLAQRDWIWSTILGVLIVANMVLWARGRARRAREAKHSLSAPTTPKIDIAKVRRNYPDVPIFTDFNRMVAEFPTSRGEEPTPETDPNFWTRGI